MFTSLLRLPLMRLCREEVLKLESEMQILDSRLREVEQQSVKHLWNQDLDMLEQVCRNFSKFGKILGENDFAVEPELSKLENQQVLIVIRKHVIFLTQNFYITNMK